MADKGFNISDLLIYRGSKLVMPPFLGEKEKSPGEIALSHQTLPKQESM